MSSTLPFQYERGVIDGYVTITPKDREYGIQKIHVPEDFWPEGRYLLAKIWGKKNPKIHSDGTFQEVGGVTTFHFSPCTVNAGRVMSVLKTLTSPVYAASRSIKCLVEWPEMQGWKASNQNGGGFGSDSPLEKHSPVKYMLETMGKEINYVPFGDGPMVLGESAELDYLANAS